MLANKKEKIKKGLKSVFYGHEPLSHFNVYISFIARKIENTYINPNKLIQISSLLKTKEPCSFYSHKCCKIYLHCILPLPSLRYNDDDKNNIHLMCRWIFLPFSNIKGGTGAQTSIHNNHIFMFLQVFKAIYIQAYNFVNNNFSFRLKVYKPLHKPSADWYEDKLLFKNVNSSCKV